MFCNLTLITVIFFLVPPKQSSRNYSSNDMQQWILNCLQASQAAHKNIIKRQMPFVLITSKLHKLKCLNTSNTLQYIEMCSLGAGDVVFQLTAHALLPVTVVWFDSDPPFSSRSQESERGLLGSSVTGRYHIHSSWSNLVSYRRNLFRAS